MGTYSCIRALAVAATLAVTVQESFAQCPPELIPGIGTPGTDGWINALALRPDGGIVAGGSITNAGGVPVNNIALFQPTVGGNGNWSSLGEGAGGSVYAILARPDFDVFVGGIFLWNGSTYSSLVTHYHNSNGTWTALSPNDWGGAGVRTLLRLPSGDLIAGGHFFSSNVYNNVARYDFDIDPFTGQPFGWSSMGGGVRGQNGLYDPVVRALALLPNGDVIVGGRFSMAGAIGANNLARYHSSTNTWSTIESGVQWAPPELNHIPVRALAVLPNGNVIAAGDLGGPAGSVESRVTMYTPATNRWVLQPGVLNGPVASVVALPEGDVIITGDFSYVGTQNLGGLVRYSPSTGQWSSPVGFIDGNGRALLVTNNGDVVVGGEFSMIGGVASSRIARFSPGTAAPNGSMTPDDELVAPCVGGRLSLTVTMSPQGTYSYRWYRSGNALSNNDRISGATTHELVIEPLVEADGDASVYSCWVTPAGSCAAQEVLGPIVMVRPQPSLMTNPESQSVCVGYPVTFAVQAQASSPLSFQWSKDEVPIPGATALLYTISSARLEDEGDYSCRVSTTTCEIMSDDATLDVSSQCGPTCDSVDFNNDTSLFDPQDIEAFLSVYSEGPCVPSGATCGDIDFNNDTSLFDPCDISSFLLMYSEGPCTACGT